MCDAHNGNSKEDEDGNPKPWEAQAEGGNRCAWERAGRGL